MNKATASFLITGLLVLANHSYADSATWSASPTSNIWNKAANWVPATVPNGPTDTATFDVSSTTDLTFSAVTEVNGITFDAGASAYTFEVIPPVILTISGTGIVNNSGTTQTFVMRDHAGKRGIILFTNFAKAGDGNIFMNRGSSFAGNVAATEFHDNSNAGTSTFVNVAPFADFSGGGLTLFYDHSSAGASTIISEAPHGSILDGGPSETDFYDSSNAGEATLIAASGHVPADSWGEIDFWDQSTAKNAVITVEGGPDIGILRFNGDSTAANAFITSGGFLFFYDNSSAGNAVIVLDDGSYASITGSSSGGTAVFRILGSATFDMQLHSAPGTSVGSIEGDGTIQLAQSNLTVGTNDQSTTFSGLIEDLSAAGSLTKVGLGTLTLSGTNTYAAGTTVEAGTLVVTNKAASATGKGPVQVDAGTLGGRGLITGAVTVGTGSGAGAVLAPAAGGTKQTTLTMQSALTLQADATYTCTATAKHGRANTDVVVANGVTINGAAFSFQPDVQGVLQPGLVLTVISNTAATPIAGTFSNLADGAIITAHRTNFQASYEGGDGNDLTLTVVP